MVFQNYALYAHMTVAANIGFGLKMNDMPKAEIAPRVQRAAEILGITDLLKRKPRQLSGGQRQRVAMGRAIVREPAAFLMDEPLSNLDAKLRVEMRAEITSVQRRIGAPTLYVTHDQTEAMTMGDRVAILRDGVLEQLGTPLELYDAPVNVVRRRLHRVAGDEPRRRDDRGRVRHLVRVLRRARVPIPHRPARAPRPVRRPPVRLGLRPGGSRARRRGGDRAAGAAHGVARLGDDRVPGRRRRAAADRALRSPRRRSPTGRHARIPVDLDRLYFFDAETGAAIR